MLGSNTMRPRVTAPSLRRPCKVLRAHYARPTPDRMTRYTPCSG